MKTVIVTRPAPESDAWVDRLQAQGVNALALPLLTMGSAPDAALLERFQAAAAGYDACLFVSPQAVRFFSDPRWTQATGRCWAPGPGTAQALMAQGVEARRIDQPDPHAPQFDSEALWAVVASQVRSGHRLLAVRGLSPDGHTGRDWLQKQCEARGGQVDTCVAYRRLPSVWTIDQMQQARQALVDGSVWLLSSSEALSHLVARFPGHDWSQVCALVTHPQIALSARNMGFGEIITTRPAITDVLAGLHALT
jgi:uroporphyrinogen-III synthase